MSFTGQGSEYFRIWIVNLVLTILTLGVYSAWAKVRRLQYFYRHTRLAGSGFDYHGDPIAILKGRIVGLMLFGLYAAISYVQFWLAVAILAALALVMPWLVSRSLQFRLHNSSYRGIRFRFSGGTASAYWVFLALPMLTVLSLFLLGPFWHHRIKRYEFANAAYRPHAVRVSRQARRLLSHVRRGRGRHDGVHVPARDRHHRHRRRPGTREWIGSARSGYGSDAAGRLCHCVYHRLRAHGGPAVQSITAARIQNTVWNTMRLGPHGFTCQVGWFKLFGISLTNLLLTVLTLGLFRPFAQVRLARYFASVFVMVPSGPLDDLLAAESEEVSAIGEEAVGFFDLDVGF